MSCSTRSIMAALLLAGSAAAQTTIKLNQPLPLNPATAGGDVLGMELTPDGSRVVYLARESADARAELRSLPTGGAHASVRLTGALPGAETLVDDFRISADGAHVVFTSTQWIEAGDESYAILRLYSVPTAGGTAPELLARIETDDGYLETFQISPDSAWVVFEVTEFQLPQSDENLYAIPIDGQVEPVLLLDDEGGFAGVVATAGGRVVTSVPGESGQLELYSVAFDGTGLVRLNGTLVAGGRVEEFRVSPDGARVLYRADETTDQVFELFSAPVDGSAAAVRVSGPLVAGGDVHELVISPDSTRVAYRADQLLDNQHELFVAPIDGSAVPVKVSGDLDTGRDVEPGFVFATDGSRVAWRADALVNDALELFSAPSDGSAAPVPLSGTLVSGGDVGVPLAGAGGRLAYLADATVNEQVELFSVPADGSAAPTRLSGLLIPAGDVEGMSTSLDGTRVLFRADADADQVRNLFAAPTDGSTAAVRINVLAPGPLSFRVSPDGAHVFYRAAEDAPGFTELYRRPSDGSAPSAKVNGLLSSGDVQGDVNAFVEDPVSRRIVYEADQEQDERDALVSATTAGPLAHVQLNDDVDVGGSIGAFWRAGSHVVYVQRTSSSSAEALFGVPSDRSQPPVRLSPALATRVGTFLVHPDEASVIFVAGVHPDFRLYRAAVDGSSPAIDLSGALGEVEDAFAIQPDGSHVLFLVETDGVRELYGVPADGSAAPIRLNQPLVAGGDVVIGHSVDAPLVTPGGHVIFRADAEVDERFELFSVPIDGSELPVKLSGALVAGGDVQAGFQRDPLGQRVVFRADRFQHGVVELFSVAVDGSGVPVRLNPGLMPAGDVGDFLVHPDGTRVVFAADLAGSGGFELFTASILAGERVTPLSGPSVHGGGVREFELDPTGTRVVYHADALLRERIELFVAPLDASSSPLRLSAPLVEDGDVRDFQFALDGKLVVYRADQERDEVHELFSVPLDGSRAPRRVNEPLDVGHEVSRYRISADGSRVFYVADQDEPWVFELYQAFLRPPIASRGAPELR